MCYFKDLQILLYHELSMPGYSGLNITPFSIIVAFLVADTSRVFFTRILSGNNPMSADTIHLHHLVLLLHNLRHSQILLDWI